MIEESLAFRKAGSADIPEIWKLLQQAIERRRKDGSSQWQSGYPNLNTVENDVENGFAYVLTLNDKIIASAALIFNNEPTYDVIDGAWLTLGEFLVVHRIAVSDEVVGKGFIKKFFQFFEKFAKENQIFSIKIDTNFDNIPMLKILEKSGYTHCGEIQVYDGPRMAFEKVLR